MSFNHPLGLLGLIGIPILIILYIIKSHYTEQQVASVYLWQLSEKFLKKKKRLRFGGLLSLLLQILAVTAISLTIAGPKFILENAANDYCFVLDASGSMRAEQGDTNRFQTGKQQIRQIIEQSKDGSSYTLVYAGSSSYIVCDGEQQREAALAVLDTLECEWGESSCADALALVQDKYTADHSPLTYLVTDRDYQSENITLLKIGQEDQNYAFVAYSYTVKGGALTVSGQVISSHREGDVTVELYIDGEKAEQTTVSVQKQTATDFQIQTTCGRFAELTLRIANEDSFMDDNEGVLYTTGQEQNNRTLIVSDASAYLEFALLASRKTAVDVVSTKKYGENKDAYSGYNLYIFDNCSNTACLPDAVPEDAAVWFFGVQKSIAGSGFSFREVVEAEGLLPGSSEGEQEIENRFEPTYTTASSSTVKSFTEGLLKQIVAVKKYARYTPNRNFTNLMYQGSDSLIFVGENEKGNRQVTFAFDLHDSDFPLKADFLILMNNLLGYSFPAVVEQTLFCVGEELTVNIPAGCSDLLLEAPDGKISYPDFSGSTAYCSLDQVGTYKITAHVQGSQQQYYVYSHVPAAESYDMEAGTLNMEKMSDSTASDGYYDKLILYFLILALAFVLDWGVYCYEQYQLR